MATVLALIDEEGLRQQLAAILGARGHSVSFDAAAPPSASHAHDVVVVDVVPGEADDIFHARAERARHEQAPTILLVPTLDDDVLERGAHLLPAAYVRKPLVERELAAALTLAAHRNDSDRRTAARERSLKTTLRSIGDAVITADEASEITFINTTAQALTGWSEEDALHRPVDDVFAVEAGEDAPASDDGRPLLRLRRRDGTSIHIEHNASPIVEESGALHGVVVVFRDITERRRIEQRLALSGRMTSIGTLAAGIAHELNNPLAFVTSNIDFVVAELAALEGTGKQRVIDADVLEDSLAALREAADGASRAAQIVKDMKVFIRGEADAKTAVDVNRAISFAARLTNSEVKHHGELHMELSAVPPMLADEGKLVQVFVNVLTNAAQAADPKKTSHTIRVTSGVERGHVVVRIHDTGAGIAPEHLGRVFEPFFTTRPVGQGLGLGLSISHTIVSAFGGSIGIESTAGEGTTVTVTLPIADGHYHEDTVVAVAAPPSRKRVLVIDDETLIGAAVRRILTKADFDVVVESDGRGGYTKATDERFDVILCDLMMPGFSGVDFYEQLQQSKPQLATRVILMTGNAFTPRARELFENTANVTLDKPFVPADLVAAVNEVLRRHA